MNPEHVHKSFIQTANAADRQHQPHIVADAMVETMRQLGNMSEKNLTILTNLTPLMDCTYLCSVLSHFFILLYQIHVFRSRVASPLGLSFQAETLTVAPYPFY